VDFPWEIKHNHLGKATAICISLVKLDRYLFGLVEKTMTCCAKRANCPVQYRWPAAGGDVVITANLCQCSRAFLLGSAETGVGSLVAEYPDDGIWLGMALPF